MENTATLTIVIRERNSAGNPSEGLKQLLCMYLGTFGGDVKVIADRRLHALQGVRDAPRATALDLELTRTAQLNLEDLSAKVHTLLKRTAKDAELDCTFEIFHLAKSSRSENEGS